MVNRDSWKEDVIAASQADYLRIGNVVGRSERMRADDQGRLWVASEFVARSKVPYTTSAVEAGIRRRHLERLVRQFSISPQTTTLDLGCADGILTHDLLQLGFERVVATDILYSSVARLESTLQGSTSERVMLVVDDLHKLPFKANSLGMGIAWGVLSVSGDFEGALTRVWHWIAPGGFLLFAEPLLEHALVYALVRRDLNEFHRTLRERSRPVMWDQREKRYGLKTFKEYATHIGALPGAAVVSSGGINLLPSLVLGGLIQDQPVSDQERCDLVQLLSDPALDEISLSRQAFWLLRKA